MKKLEIFLKRLDPFLVELFWRVLACLLISTVLGVTIGNFLTQ
ncbi:hypothetical protein [Hymenobacter sp. YC55]|nr:hypothetical protein [Hymenobacter sp. YC55]MDF7810781.1 hypothetical protein [Hymenobacter sp. YC55]